MKMARTTHALGRDGNGMMIVLVNAGGVFVLERQGNNTIPAASIMLTAAQIRDMTAVANPTAQSAAPA